MTYLRKLKTTKAQKALYDSQKQNIKSCACSKVLQRMDKGFSYCEALKIVLTKIKAELEAELDIYI